MTTGHQIPLMNADVVSRPDCPICGSSSRVHFRDVPYDDRTFTHHFRCESCGLIYMDPVPAQAWYDRLYGNEFWEVKSVGQSKTDVWTNERQWHKGLARAEKYIALLRKVVPQLVVNSVLEIGASFGLIGTTVAEAYGARAFGVEPNHSAREFASRASGMNMVAETAAGLDRWQPDAPVDLAIFSNVLENIIDIRAALTAVRGKLRSGGILLIETPNIDWQPSMSIYHPYCFSAAALQILLAQCGFRVRRVSCSGKPSSNVVPRYLTVISEAIEVPLPHPRPQHAGSTSMARIRHSLYRGFYKSPLGGIDSKFAWNRFHKTPMIQSRIGKLRANLRRLKAVQ